VLRPTRVITAAAAVFCSLAAMLAPATTAYAADPGDTIVMPVRDALAALPVQGAATEGQA